MARKNKSEIDGINGTGEGVRTEDYDTIYTEQETGAGAGTDSTSSGNTGNTSNELTAAKRGRGRPKGSTNKTRKEKEVIGLQEEEVKTGNSGSTNFYKKKENTRKFLSEEEANNTANFILTTVNELAVNFIDSEAGFNALELTLLNMSLPKYLATLELSTLEKGSNLLYPIAGLLGGGMYALRVGSILYAKTKVKKEVEKEVSVEENDYTSEVTEDNKEGIDWTKDKIDLSSRVRGF